MPDNLIYTKKIKHLILIILCAPELLCLYNDILKWKFPRQKVKQKEPHRKILYTMVLFTKDQE
jgi:hypothetical protein